MSHFKDEMTHSTDSLTNKFASKQSGQYESAIQRVIKSRSMTFIKMWLYPSLIGVMCLSLPLPYPNPEILPTPERLANGNLNSLYPM